MFSLKLTELKIEEHTLVGNSTQLECKYDLQGEKLYTVKWYKDGKEFYRFLPGESPEVQVFEVSGVHVDVSLILIYHFFFFLLWEILILNYSLLHFQTHHIFVYIDRILCCMQSKQTNMKKITSYVYTYLFGLIKQLIENVISIRVVNSKLLTELVLAFKLI